jgi:hypothetical protein
VQGLRVGRWVARLVWGQGLQWGGAGGGGGQLLLVGPKVREGMLQLRLVEWGWACGGAGEWRLWWRLWRWEGQWGQKKLLLETLGMIRRMEGAAALPAMAAAAAVLVVVVVVVAVLEVGEGAVRAAASLGLPRGEATCGVE